MTKSGQDSGGEPDPMDWDGLVKEDGGSGSDAPDEELALRIAIQRSWLDIGGSSSSVASAASSSGSHRRNAGRARPSHSAPLQIRSRAAVNPSPPAPAPPGQCWVLVPAAPVRMCTPKSKAKAARRERQRAAEPGSSRQRARSVPVDPKEALLREVMHRSLTTAEFDARRLRRKNAKALRLGLEASERLAREETTAAKAARRAKEQQRLLRRLSGYISLASESGTTSTDDDDDPPAVDAYTEMDRRAADRKGKGPKW